MAFLRDEKKVVILGDKGEIIPAQFEVLARWDDGSIRWLLARFFIAIRANETLYFTASITAGSSKAVEEKIVFEKEGDFLVDTGLIHCRIGLKSSEGIQITDNQGKDLLARGPALTVFSPAGDEYHCGSPDTRELECNGPLYASIFLAGPMFAKETGFDDIFRYETRFHFWKGLGYIAAEHTVVAVGAADNGITEVDGIALEFKAKQEYSECIVAGQNESHRIDLKDAHEIRLKQNCAYWHECVIGSDPVKEPVKYVVLEDDFGY